MNKRDLGFLKSSFCEEGSHISTLDTIDWLNNQNNAEKVNIEKTKFGKLDGWSFVDKQNSIRHKTGKFFSILGINVKTNWGNVPEWDQPIINQAEIGYLGFIVKELNGILHFLVQAKIEPGNVNYVQLSPTLQATRSNYTQVHEGKKPLYLEYFQNAKSQQILLDQLQSEQGARFLRKRNRNIIIKVDEEIEVCDNFIWLTLAQIKKLISYDNFVNMDTRTVISGIPFGSHDAEVINFFDFLGYKKDQSAVNKKFLKSALSNDKSLHSIDGIITFLTQLKSTYDLEIKQIPLARMKKWNIGDEEIYHQDRKYFKVIGVNVEIGNREVINWSQPIVEPAQNGLCAFVCREINGILHFAVQAKLECGNHDIIEFAPTVQCLTGNYRHTNEGHIPFLEYVLNATTDQIAFDALLSEEGGRFFREQNRNMIIIAGDEIANKLPEKYIWMTLNQLHTFLKFNNFLNVQSRSLISAITFI